jgi:endonuclease/exonuclease/phosphatase family metal-dependent hydrolase
MEEKIFRIGTLNIQKRNRFPHKANRIEDHLMEESGDLLFLQECLLEHDGSIIGLERLRKYFGFEASSVSRKFRNGIWMGNAILSKLPLNHIKTLTFRHARGMSQRSALVARLQREHKDFLFVALHLGLMENERRIQLEEILSYCHATAADFDGLVLGGDFNDWSGQCHRTVSLWSHAHKNWPALSSSEKISTRSLPATYPAAFPIFALDRIYAWGACQVQRLRSLPPPLVSDHRALVADLHFN